MRVSVYSSVSNYLESLNDEQLLNLLQDEKEVHSGIGGIAINIELNGTTLFVKQLPLNELEKIKSTKNLFNLPLFYQYGIGSSGFNSWREVSAHLICNEWILSNENTNFPFLYHHRVLNTVKKKKIQDEQMIKKHASSWDQSPSIEQRFRANHQAEDCIVLFLEFIPLTLNQWLLEQVYLGKEAIDSAIKWIERDLIEAMDFLHLKKLLHFDAHFRNILTDGKTLYFSDFGLAISPQFELSDEEHHFFESHRNYDRCYVYSALINWILKTFFKKDLFEKTLKDFATGQLPQLPETVTPFLTSLLKRHAPLTLKMNSFFDALIINKQTPYPKDELEKLILVPKN